MFFASSKTWVGTCLVSTEHPFFGQKKDQQQIVKSGVSEKSSRVCAASRHVVHTQRLLRCRMDHSLRFFPGVC